MTVLLRWLLRRAERHPDPVLAALRTQLLTGLSGTVVEVGCGRGALFGHYGPGVSRLLAIEPDPLSRAAAEQAAAQAGARRGTPIEVLAGQAERLPLADAQADAVILAEVLCSVPDPDAVLAEAARVLRSGGELRVFEHVLAARAAGRLAQRAVDAAGWPRLLGGCHTARDSTVAIRQAGFDWVGLRRVWYASVPLTAPAGPHILGVAIRA